MLYYLFTLLIKKILFNLIFWPSAALEQWISTKEDHANASDSDYVIYTCNIFKYIIGEANLK